MKTLHWILILAVVAIAAFIIGWMSKKKMTLSDLFSQSGYDCGVNYVDKNGNDVKCTGKKINGTCWVSSSCVGQ